MSIIWPADDAGELVQSLPVLSQRPDEPVHLARRPVPPRAMAVVVVGSGESRREFARCLTCAAAGDDVVIEVFADDPEAVGCPVAQAWELYYAWAASVFDDTVVRALTGARREAETVAVLLARVRQ